MEYLIGFIICLVLGWACWESTLILDARKQAYKAGTHDYYGNKISDKEQHMEFFTANTGWLLLAYALGTAIGIRFGQRSAVKQLAEDIIDSLIEQKFLKTRGNADNVEIIKYTEWCNDKDTR